MIFERIKKLCEENGTSITALCKELTNSAGNLPTWKKGKINANHIAMIADKFSVNADWILFGKEPKYRMSDQPKSEKEKLLNEINSMIGELSDEQVRILGGTIKGMVSAIHSESQE